MPAIVTRQHLITWLAAALLTALSLSVHLAAPSSLHLSEADWRARVELHQKDDTFRVRPFTTAVVVFLHDTIGTGYRTAFFALQFALIFLSGPAFFHYLKSLGYAFGPAMGGMMMFYLSIPVLLVHFDPMYTWSDAWVYLTLPLSLACLRHRREAAAVIFFAWALLARETSLIFAPVWLMYAVRVAGGRWMRPAVMLVAALVLFVVARWILTDSTAGHLQFKLAFNFAGPLRSRDTVFSLLASLGFLWPIGIYQIFRSGRGSISHYNLIRGGAAVTAAGYVVSTLLFAQARETRLFFPPVVFFIPLALEYIGGLRRLMVEHRPRIPRWAAVSAIAVIAALGIGTVTLIFPEFDFRTWQDGHRILLGGHLAAATVLIVWPVVVGRRIGDRGQPRIDAGF